MSFEFDVPGGGGTWGSITGTLSAQTDLQAALDLLVPYTGASANVDLGGFNLSASQVVTDTIINGFGQPVLDAASFALFDGSAAAAINLGSRQLVDSSLVPSIDWSLREGYSDTGVGVFGWTGGFYVLDLGATEVFNADLRVFRDANVVDVVVFVDGVKLNRPDGSRFLDTSTGSIYHQDGVEIMLDIPSSSINDSNGNIVWDIDGTQFYAGGVTKIDYSGNYVALATRGSVSPTTLVPSAQWQVNGAAATATYVKITNGTTGTSASDGFDVGVSATGVAELRQRENLALEAYTNNTLRLQITGAGVFDSSGSTQMRGPIGSASVPTWSFAAGTTDGFYRSATNQLSWSVNGNERLRLDSSGKFTIYQGTALRGAMATVYSQFNSVGNVGVGEDNLHSVSVPSSGFAANGDSFEVRCSGTFAANANNKRVRLKFGAITLFDTTALAFNTGDWEINARIFRTTTTTGRSIVTWTCSNATLTTTCDYQAWAFNFLISNTLVVTGEATADNDIVQELMQVFWIPTS